MWLSGGPASTTKDSSRWRKLVRAVGRAKDGTHFLDSSRDVLNEQLAKVVEGLEFTGLETTMKQLGLWAQCTGSTS